MAIITEGLSVTNEVLCVVPNAGGRVVMIETFVFLFENHLEVH